MDLTCVFKPAKIGVSIRAAVSRWLAVLVRRLERIGIKAVSFARDRGAEESWYDRTGNLRSSIGYVVVSDGAVTSKYGFTAVSGPDGGGGEGASEGERFAVRLASEHPTGYALIIVAGMDYAVFVEAMENKDVLASAELFLRKEIQAMTARL